jgi:tetratricopeptide (TPR) repeat protein
VAELTAADRVVALLEWGDVAEADAEIDAIEEQGASWEVALWRGARALMEGRFVACERWSAEAFSRGDAAREPRAAVLATLLVVNLRREQERPAEAEAVLRALLDDHPSAPAGAHALLALLVGEMGRDTQARQELSRLLPRDPLPATGRLAPLFLLAELAPAVHAGTDDVALLSRRLQPHARDFAVEEGGAAFYGSTALALGRLAQARGRVQEAARRFEEALAAHDRVGAPLLLAHTQRHLAALLRSGGDEADWERSVALLASAATIYRHLGVDGAAAETQAVLARSMDGLGPADALAAGDAPIFRRQGDQWLVGRADDPVRLRDARGLHDIARLLAAPRRSIHVGDLLALSRHPAGDDPIVVGVGRADVPPALRVSRVDEPVLDPATRAEYEARLTELAGELVEAERAGAGVRAALARAERDVLAAALAEDDRGDPLDRARRTVGTRIRISLDRIEQADPPVGRHLRTCIRTGTFCSYEPDRPVRWVLS